MNFIFDLYGTLIDIWTDESSEAFWRSVCSLISLDGDDWNALKTHYSVLCVEKKRDKFHEIDLIEVFSEIIASHNAKISANELATAFRNLSMKRLRLFPSVKETLKELRTFGAGVYLLSNAQECFTRAELEDTGLLELFDGIILSSKEGVKKPSGRIFDRAFVQFGISPNDSYYVGNDLYDDVYGASRVGIKTIYIKTEQSGEYDATKLPSPDYIAIDHSDLSKILISLASENKIHFNA
jgi:putative hydrolase of the HAD superfamily